jgi:uncharacterized protein Yka (UPF0111/DUF47 family)
VKTFRGILVLGEKTVFGGLSELLKIAAQTNELLQATFKDVSNEQTLNENLQAIRSLEKHADALALKLSEDITSGAISPNLIDDLIECVRYADDIVDLHFYLCRELSRMSKADTEQFGPLKNHASTQIYERLLASGAQSMSKLQQILSAHSIPDVLRLHNEIEAIEEDADDIKDAGFDKLYGEASLMHFLQFYHYSELLHKCDDILDTCEDLSDLLVSVITSIVK